MLQNGLMSCRLLTAGAVALGEITALNHKVLDDAMELAAGIAVAFRRLRQLLEVLDGLRHGLAEQSDDDAAGGLVSDLDVEVDLCTIGRKRRYMPFSVCIQ